MPLKIIEILSTYPKRLLLIDASGATVSAMFLGLVLPQMDHLIGLPIDTLHFLSGVACGIALFSWSCYLGFSKFGKSLLKSMGLINVIYCLMTFSVVIFYCQTITGLGLLYFGIEVLIILIIAYAESKAPPV